MSRTKRKKKDDDDDSNSDDSYSPPISTRRKSATKKSQPSPDAVSPQADKRPRTESLEKSSALSTRKTSHLRLRIDLPETRDYQDHANDLPPINDDGSNSGISPDTFPAKFHDLLTKIERGNVKMTDPVKNVMKAEAQDLSHIISWQSQGRSFQIHDVGAFERQVLPAFFNISNISTFRRQLCLYGFRRVSRSAETYFHELFLRDRGFLAMTMDRIPVHSRSRGIQEYDIRFDDIPVVLPSADAKPPPSKDRKNSTSCGATPDTAVQDSIDIERSSTGIDSASSAIARLSPNMALAMPNRPESSADAVRPRMAGPTSIGSTFQEGFFRPSVSNAETFLTRAESIIPTVKPNLRASQGVPSSPGGFLPAGQFTIRESDVKSHRGPGEMPSEQTENGIRSDSHSTRPASLPIERPSSTRESGEFSEGNNSRGRRRSSRDRSTSRRRALDANEMWDFLKDSDIFKK